MFLDRHRDSKAAAAAALIASSVACSNEANEPSGGPSDAASPVWDAAFPDAEEPARTYAPTFSAVWAEVLYSSCGASYCHSGDQTGLMLMTADQAYDDLVGKSPKGVDCRDSGLLLVEPGHPESSLIYLKVVDPPCGALMPHRLGRIPDRDIEQIRGWIELGAMKD